MAIWRMRIAWWVPEATHTHSQYVILTACPQQQQWLHERTSMLRYTHIACPVSMKVTWNTNRLCVQMQFLTFTAGGANSYHWALSAELQSVQILLPVKLKAVDIQ